MATSGTTSFNLTNDDLIIQAYERLGGGDITGFDLKNALTAINLLLINLENEDVMLWKLSLNTLVLVADVDEYVLPAGVDGILDAVLRTSAQIEVAMDKTSLIEFNRIAKKGQQGQPMQYTVARNRDSTSIKVWPLPKDNTFVMNYWAVTRIEDAGNLRNTVDISYRFIPAFIFGLAYELSFVRNGVPPDYRQELLGRYQDLLMKAKDDYRERVSWRFKPKLNIPR